MNMTRMTLRLHKGQKKICSQRPRTSSKDGSSLAPSTHSHPESQTSALQPLAGLFLHWSSASPLPCQLVSPVRSEMLRRQEERIQEGELRGETDFQTQERSSAPREKKIKLIPIRQIFKNKKLTNKYSI